MMKSERARLTLAVVGLAVLGGCVAENEAAEGPIVKGGDDATGEYMAVADWWKPAPDHTSEEACEANPATCWGWGQVSGVVVDNPDRIIVAV